MPDPILPPSEDRYAKARDLERVIAAEARAPALVQPIAFPAFPYGGDGPPSALWYIPVVGAAYGVQATVPWIFQPDRVSHRGVTVAVPWATDAATTGELRLASAQAPALNTSSVALPAGGSGTVTFRWLHGITLWVAGVSFAIEARRTGGAGEVKIGYPPGGLIIISPDGCTDTGI